MRAAVFAAAMLVASPARGDDRAASAPEPPTLPALAHPKLTDTFEITGASIDPGRGHGRAYAWFVHDEVEYPLIPRVFFVGAAHDVVSGAVPGVGRGTFLGAPEIWTRGLWSSVIGLSSGGGFGVVIPAPRSLSESDREVFEDVRVVRPWDAAYFTDRVLTMRPWIDLRYVVWRLAFQLRQGIDIGIVVRDLRAGERRTDYVGRTSFYAGVRVAAPLAIGVELWEVYQISADLSDDKRAAFSVSPGVRLFLGRVEPALSLVFPVSTPLRGEAASYLGGRLNVGFTFDVAGLGGGNAPR